LPRISDNRCGASMSQHQKPGDDYLPSSAQSSHLLAYRMAACSCRRTPDWLPTPFHHLTISGRNLIAYPDASIRLAISRAIAVETARGWRIAKDKQSHKIDVVVVLAMAAYAALQTPKGYDTSLAWIDGTPLPPDKQVMQFDNGYQRRADANYIASGAYSRNQTYAAMSAFGKTGH
jgi:hypothetical protein